jgi:hypothetical protein
MPRRTPRYIQERSDKLRAAKTKTNSIKASWDWKYWTTAALAVLAVFLAIVSMTWRPDVSIESPLDPNDVMSTQFVLENGAWFDFTHVKAAAVSKNIKTTLVSVGEMDSGWQTLPLPSELPAGEKKTIPYPLQSIHFGGTVLAGDFGLVISYTPKYLPFWKRKRGFLFTIGVQSDGRSRFQRQPGQEVEKEYEQYEQYEKSKAQSFPY